MKKELNDDMMSACINANRDLKNEWDLMKTGPESN